MEAGPWPGGASSLAPRPAWMKPDGWVQPWLPQTLSCDLDRSLHLSKPRTPQRHSREGLLNFFFYIELCGGSLTWAGNVLPNLWDTTPPPEPGGAAYTLFLPAP